MPEIRNALISTNNEEIVKHNTPVKSAFGNLTKSTIKLSLQEYQKLEKLKNLNVKVAHVK